MATSTEVFRNSAVPHPHGGVKRTANDAALENEQRLSKRLDLLSLGRFSRPRALVAPRADILCLDSNGNKLYLPLSDAETRRIHRRHSPPPNAKVESADNDYMNVEETPHRIFIQDLDKELAEIESDEENPIFLADIEKHMNKIPKFLLTHDKKLKPTETNQLVLYNVPMSLTVPQEQDNVRKAIVEARARIRENQAFNNNSFGSDAIRVLGGSEDAQMTDGELESLPLQDNAAIGKGKRPVEDDIDEMDVEEEL